MRVGRTRVALWALGALVAGTLSAVAQQPPPSGFGARRPAIIGITSDTSAERAFRLLTTHGDLWGARSKVLREDKAASYIQRLTLQLSPQSADERRHLPGKITVPAELKGMEEREKRRQAMKEARLERQPLAQF